MKRLAVVLASCLLAACGGGSDSTSSSAIVLGFVATSNVDSIGFPWGGSYPGIVKRWSLPIPVKTNGEPRAAAAMDTIEAKLGVVIFDRTSLNSVAEASVIRGIVFRQGTAYLPAGANPQSYCANASGGPFTGGYPSGFVRTSGEISARIYVNLDNPQCTASAEISIHELGHALGMGAHFEGFGYGPAISSDFWSVLATLYFNTIGTAKANIVLKSVN